LQSHRWSPVLFGRCTGAKRSHSDRPLHLTPYTPLQRPDSTGCRHSMSADQTPHSVNRVIFVLYCRFSGFILANPNVSNDAAAATSTIHCHEKSLTKYTPCYDDRHTYTKYNCRCSCVLLVLSSEWSVHECKYSSFRAATWRRSFDQNCDSHLAGRWMDMNQVSHITASH
jgi:hypothetical protein